MDALPAAALGASYLLAVRVLLPYIVRVGRAAAIVIIGVGAFILLLPDLISTSKRRAAGRQPAAWTFSVGDGILRTHGRWVDTLHQIKPKAKQHTRLAIAVTAGLILLPVAAYYGSKSNNPRLHADAATALDWYVHLDRWAHK